MFKALISEFGITVSEYTAGFNDSGDENQGVVWEYVKDVVNIPLQKGKTWTLFQLTEKLMEQDESWMTDGPWAVEVAPVSGKTELTVPVRRVNRG